jgi:hypothetical protein
MCESKGRAVTVGNELRPLANATSQVSHLSNMCKFIFLYLYILDSKIATTTVTTTTNSYAAAATINTVLLPLPLRPPVRYIFTYLGMRDL